MRWGASHLKNVKIHKAVPLLWTKCRYQQCWVHIHKLFQPHFIVSPHDWSKPPKNVVEQLVSGLVTVLVLLPWTSTQTPDFCASQQLWIFIRHFLSVFFLPRAPKTPLTIAKKCGRNHSANLADNFLEASGVSFCMEFKICSNFKSSFSASLEIESRLQSFRWMFLGF